MRQAASACRARVPARGGSTRQIACAFGQRVWKTQPGGGSSGLGISPLDGDGPPAAVADARHRLQQGRRVGVRRGREQFLARRHLYQSAEI